MPQDGPDALRLLLAAAFTLSPRVELTGPGWCTVDLRGADPGRTQAELRLRLLDLARAGLPARGGIAPTPHSAACAARRGTDGALVAVADAPAFLAPLAVSFADPDAQQAKILRGWGVRTLGELAALAKGDVAHRLGAGALALWERAAGRDARPLRHAQPARSFAAEWSYEPPVESAEPLLFRLRRFAECIALELRGADLAAERLAFTLLLEHGGDRRREFALPEPSADAEGWVRVLQGWLAGVRTPARIAAARLAATPCRLPGRQGDLFESGLRDPAAFWENLARVAAITGEGSVGTPEPADTHRPDRFTLARPAGAVAPPEPPPPHPARGLALRRFRPPWPAQVALAAGRPETVDGPRLRGAVRETAGPWRASGAWWTPEPWAVETWQVELASGGVYQLALTAEGWVVEGMLD